MTDKEGKVIQFHDQETLELVELGAAYDEVSEAALKVGLPHPDICIIMANRLGELLRIYTGEDKDKLLSICAKFVKDRAYNE